MFHVNLRSAEAALHADLEFVQGRALGVALKALTQEERSRSAEALRHFETFCLTNHVPIYETPGGIEGVSASWLQQTDQALSRLLLQARHHDLVVVSRRRSQDHLPSALIESLLLESGRPILIAPPQPPQRIDGTMVVAWKETAESARALAFALPLLKQARKVILVNVLEQSADPRESLHHCARQLAWHGIVAEVAAVGDGSRPAARTLADVAAREYAELLVVGGFGHTQTRERVFGGVTRALIDHADLPVFMAH